MKFPTLTAAVVFGLLFPVLTSGCSEGVSSRTSNHETTPQTQAHPDTNTATPAPWQQRQAWSSDIVEPPAEYYLALIERQNQRASNVTLGLAEESTDDVTPILYVDFDGEDLAYGFDADQSFILCEDTATIPAADLTASEQEEIITGVVNYFETANVLVDVVTERPASGDFTTVYVTGDIEDLGCEEDDNVLGIAPLDRGNNNLNDIGFTFTKNFGEDADPVYMTALITAHEAGHTYGLDHNDNIDAIMYPSVQTETNGFGVGYARKLVFKTRQDSPEVLREALGVLDPELLPEEEESGFTATWCERLVNTQGFVLANFPSLENSFGNWFNTPSYCE